MRGTAIADRPRRFPRWLHTFCEHDRSSGALDTGWGWWMPEGMLQGGGFNQLVRGPGVYFLYNRHDRYLGAEIAEYGHYSPDESAFLVSLIAPGNIVFDVGANIGSLTIPMARAAGRSGRLFAFEPQRLVFQVLCANIAINSLTNAECFMMCVGSQQGMLAIPELDPEVVNNFGGISAGAGRPVQCIPLDAFAGLPRIDLIKIDVEGMEREVVLGARTVIAPSSPPLRRERSKTELRLTDYRTRLPRIRHVLARARHQPGRRPVNRLGKYGLRTGRAGPPIPEA